MELDRAMNHLDNQDSLELAKLLCKKLSLDLQANDQSSISIIDRLLKDLDPECVLFAFRIHIDLSLAIKKLNVLCCELTCLDVLGEMSS